MCDLMYFQVASRALDVPVELIHISETATNVVANASLTAGSTGSELFGQAILVRTSPPSSRRHKAVLQSVCLSVPFPRWLPIAWLHDCCLFCCSVLLSPASGRDVSVLVVVVFCLLNHSFTSYKSVLKNYAQWTDVWCTDAASLQNACETLRERLKPYREKNPGATWRELVSYVTGFTIIFSTERFKEAELFISWTIIKLTR